MNFTATLFAQIATFAVLVWFIQKFLWGPLTNMMEERKKRIAEGLAAADRGKHERELAEQRAKDVLHEAKVQAAEIVGMAQKRAAEIVDEAKEDARTEGERIIESAKAEIEQETNRAREQLREQVGSLALNAAQRILQREIDASAHADVVQSIASEL
ncbi:MAG TPA: F0F1 ATP synthase subunit B [Chromatiales bacterium]|nr:F0F1 ATP synthase subunit B [Chromatiales bacterium]